MLSSDQSIVGDTLDAIQKVVGYSPIGLHEPYFAGNEKKYVSECIETGWVSSVGSFVDLFETELAAFTGSKHAIACSNGTSALFICLKLVGVERDHEVLVPDLTFVATANAVSHAEACPHFVDIEQDTLGIDCLKLTAYLEENTYTNSSVTINKHSHRPISAIIPMHCFGHPSKVDEIETLAKRFNLRVIEDAAESLGSYRSNVHTGNFGLMAAISFNGNKIITTGGGGAIITNDSELAAKAKHIVTTAKVPHKWSFNHDEVGYNYRMPNLNAALGCAQLEQLEAFIKIKRHTADKYKAAFADVNNVHFFEEPTDTKSNYWLNAILLDESCSHFRDMILERSIAVGIQTRPAWSLMHTLPMYSRCPKMDLTQAINIQKRIINLPSGVVIADCPRD